MDEETTTKVVKENPIKEWVCSVKWVQATMSDGAWFWTLYLIEADVDDEPKLIKLEEGAATTKLEVYWRIWRLCRKHGLRFRPNIRGKIE